MARLVAGLGRASYLADRAFERATGGRARLHAMWFYSQPVPAAGVIGPSTSRSATATAAPTRSVGTIVVRRVAAGEIDEAKFQRPVGVVTARFAAGSECVAALRDGELLGYAWLDFVAVDEIMVRAVFEPAPLGRAAWDYDVWIAPKYRLGRVFSRLWDEAHALLRARGVEATLSWIAMRNDASIRAHERMGAHRVGWAAFLVLGPVQLTLASVRPFVHVAWPGRAPVRLRVRGTRARR